MIGAIMGAMPEKPPARVVEIELTTGKMIRQLSQ
jgi:hypothetical protein